MAAPTDDKKKTNGKVLGVLVGLFTLSAIILVAYGHAKHSQTTYNGLLLYCIFTGVGVAVAVLLWVIEDDENVQEEMLSFKIVMGFFAACLILICLVTLYEYSVGGGVFPPVMIAGISLIVLLLTTTILVLSHIARRKNPKADAKAFFKAAPMVLYILVFLSGILGRSMLRRFAVPPITFMKTKDDYAKNMFNLALYSVPITSACIWGASTGFFNKLLLPLKMLLQAEAGDFEGNAQQVADVVGVVKNSIRSEAADYKALKLTGDNVGEFAKKSLIHMAVQTGDMFVMEEEHAKKTMLAMQEVSHNVKNMILPILRAFYALSPSGLAMLLRTLVAHTFADSIAKKSISKVSKVKRKSALVAGTFLVVFISVLCGGVGVAAAVIGLCYIPVKVLPNLLGAWSDQNPLDVAQVMAFRLVRIIDLRGYSGVGEAEGLLDYMCYATYKLWMRFKEADTLCLIEQDPCLTNKEASCDISKAENSAVAIKLRAFSAFKEATRTILVDLMNIGPAEQRGFLGNAITTMQQCIIQAETAVRDNKADELPGILQEMTRALVDPNMKLMKAHRITYLVALCAIAVCAGIGNAVGASLPKKKDTTIDRQRETATATMIICFVVIVSINSYLALK